MDMLEKIFHLQHILQPHFLEADGVAMSQVTKKLPILRGIPLHHL